MNLQAIRDRAAIRFRDTTKLIVTNDVWNDHINATYDHFLRAARWPFLIEDDDFAVGAGDRLVPIADNDVLSGLEQCYDVDRDRMLEPMPQEMTWRFQLFIQAGERGEPTFYRVLGHNLFLVPTPAEAFTLKVFFFKDPPNLALVTDTPAIPERYHEALIVGAIAKAHRDDRNDDAAAQYQGEFDGIVEQAKAELLIGELSSYRGFLDLRPGTAGSGTSAGSESAVGSAEGMPSPAGRILDRSI